MHNTYSWKSSNEQVGVVALPVARETPRHPTPWRRPHRRPRPLGASCASPTTHILSPGSEAAPDIKVSITGTSWHYVKHIAVVILATRLFSFTSGRARAHL